MSQKSNGLAAEVSERVLGRWAGAILAIIATILLSGVGWVVASTVTAQRRLAVIEVSRFTPVDARELENRIQTTIDAKLTRMEAKLDRIDDALRELAREK